METVNSNRNEFFVLFLIFCVVLSALVSPLLGFYCAIFVLLLFNINNLILRNIISVISILSGCGIYASRVIGFSMSDDFYNTYIPIYESIRNGGSIFVEQYSGGAEFGLPAVFLLFSKLGFNDNYPLMMYCISLFCSLGFYSWLEYEIIPEIDKNKKSLCIASSIAFFSFFASTQLIRQMVATVFILFCLSALRRRKTLRFIFLLVVGSIFHLTTVVVVLIFVILAFGSKKQKLVLLCSVAFISFLFKIVVGFILSGGLLSVASYKAEYYQQTTKLGFHLSGAFKFLFPATIAALFFSSSKFKKINNVLFFGMVLYIILLPMPAMSDRMLMPLTFFAIGTAIFFSFYKTPNFLKLLLSLYITYKFITMGPMYNGAGSDPFYLWSSYPWLGPFIS
ncbi:EpsG family protein [Klebsiella quasipneumoniae subsp. quasipneumoniae]|uniref:EpsG family protein n=1 Tax=Klebsiella quasipneumoniae TaxID=1463165 RepID=UPI001443CFB5|nr:EpsG family protein [Klebsiella quasipneumoniae]UDC72516.1 EpsG family protein [Klebsiella quasipneumoniae subsp. quasipneumoniae]